MPTRPVSLAIARPSAGVIYGRLQAPASAQACYVFAHGAGAGMDHAFAIAIFKGLEKRGIASSRFNFPSWNKTQNAPTHP